MSYAVSRNIAIAFLCVYALVGATGHVTRDGVEDWYPFFSWSLFVEVPAREQQSFAAYVIDDAGRTLAVPVALSNFTGFTMQGLHVSTLGFELENLGRAIQRGDTSLADTLRAQLESRFLRSATYELVLEEYRVLEKFLSGSVATSTTLGTFRVEKNL